MPEASGIKREGRRAQRLLPVFLSALIVLPNNPFVAGAFAQVVGASAESASASGSGAGASVSAGAGSLSLSAPAPLALTAQTFAAPLTAAAPSAPSAAALVSPAPLVAAAAAPALAAAPLAAARAGEAPATAPAPAAAALKSLPAAASASSRKTPASAASAPAKANEADAAASDGAALFDGQDASDAKIFIVSHGRAPVATTLGSLDQVLKENPELARGLNKKGAVRLVLGNRPAAELTASKEFAAKYPTALGLAEVSPVKQAWSGLVNN